jgi:hypothetical protein
MSPLLLQSTGQAPGSGLTILLRLKATKDRSLIADC